MTMMSKELESTAESENRMDVLLGPPEMNVEAPTTQAPAESPAAPPTSEMNHWTKDVNETGLWGKPSRKELLICVALILLMIGATVTGVVIAVQNSDDSTRISNTKIDPATGEAVSAYELPVRPPLTIISDQEELDLIRSEMSLKDTNFSEALSMIPTTVSELSSLTSTDPYVQAAIWLTTTDTYNAKEDAVTRFALAVLYYSMQGASWFQSTNWLSPSHDHGQWFGVRGCEQLRGSLLCSPPKESFGRVLEVDLFRNNLGGTIPDSVALLPYLQSLYLSENRLVGTIPGLALGSLKNFSRFYASYNFLTGTIPAVLDSNGLFSTLYIQGNDITGSFPEEFCSCPQCRDKVFFFGIDCFKIECDTDCCEHYRHCYYANNTVTTQLQ